MKEAEISKKISEKIKTAMKEKEITFEKMSILTGVPLSTLHDQLKTLSEGKFVQIKYLFMFENVLGIKIIFFEK